MSGAAAFSNGRTGEQVGAQLRLIDQGLEIRDKRDGLMLALWRLDELLPVPPAAPAPLRLTCRADPDARLTVHDPEIIAQLLRRAPRLAPRRRPVPAALTWGAGLLGAMAGIVVLCHALLWLPGPLAQIIPFRWEVAFGDGMTQPLLQRLGGECRGQAGQAALADLARRLGAAAGIGIPFQLHVARAPTINAFALPGGHIVLLNGLIQDADSADELAAVLAHEMAHVILRHVTEQTIRGLAAALLRPSYGRQAEAEADAVAAQMLQKAGISTQAMTDFFLRLGRKEKATGAVPAFLSDHPRTIARGPGPIFQSFTRPALSDPDWRSLRAICD